MSGGTNSETILGSSIDQKKGSESTSVGRLVGTLSVNGSSEEQEEEEEEVECGVSIDGMSLVSQSVTCNCDEIDSLTNTKPSLLSEFECPSFSSSKQMSAEFLSTSLRSVCE